MNNSLNLGSFVDTRDLSLEQLPITTAKTKDPRNEKVNEWVK